MTDTTKDPILMAALDMIRRTGALEVQLRWSDDVEPTVWMVTARFNIGPDVPAWMRGTVTDVPCPTCPWRRSSTVGGFDIPGFDIDKMRGLRATVGDGDAFRTIMACHYSPCGEETACVGYLAVEGISNLAVRVGAIAGRYDMPAIWAACDELDLWPSFVEMLAAYEKANG